MQRFKAKICAVAAFLILSCLPASAAEVIRNFHADVALAKSGLVTVTERIEVNAEGHDVKHGIFRDFPLTFRKEDGAIGEVDFSLKAVRRDGRDEPYKTEYIDNGIRIYAGDADTYVSSGPHVYEIVYETNRQVRYGPDADLFAWNITGNFWKFPILRADADIHLPDGVRPTSLKVYTGEAGATGSDATIRDNGPTVNVQATRSLKPKDGMTAWITLPKGAIDAPTGAQQRWWWIKDHRNAFIALIGLVLVWAWYGWSWAKVGRDPPRGIIVPRWDAPDGISPALVNYIDNKGFGDGGWKAFSAAALNLAVNGRLKLEDLKTSIILTDTKSGGPEKLPPGEGAIMARVVSAGGTLRLDKSNGTAVQAAGSAFVGAITKENRGKYYNANVGYVILGVILSVVTFVALIAFGRFSSDDIALLVVPLILAVVLGVFAGVLGKGFQPGVSVARKIFYIVVLGFLGLMAFTALGSLVSLMFEELLSHGELPVIVGLGGIIIANILAFFIMGAPTALGAKMMDGIDGLRQYLTLAEKDRMNMAGAPQMSPQHFEKLLPYAVALGVEKPWTETFDKWLAAAQMDDYHPGWYSGSNYGGFAGSVGGFSHSMASTIQSTLPAPAPSSSSGGSSGGGSSGGGGGGGGGGGW
ncbi:DUF2207 domain-containing protein [Rhizobium sp. C4]|uniref:DUF2207 domain-containing protein n=1 Tax=Rhizobium sp. C4 TaxID=1349800 RepID=UPI001E309481|nr:DUF2207 domain-containing protein [Rhizobium sp. C4]MCD2172927.1 DUF2207 domain-containing protein [Rhizobium sp. C4]